MNQTALDWYWDKIKSHFEHDGDLFETATFTLAIAKQKEKEQIMSAYDMGNENQYKRICISNHVNIDEEKYYNETYGK